MVLARKKPTGRRNKVNSISLEYTDELGTTHLIRAMLRKAHFADPWDWKMVLHFTVPMDVDKRAIKHRNFHKWGRMFHGTAYWNMRGLHALVNADTQVVEGVEHFLKWAAEQEVLITPQRFKKLLHDEHYEIRKMRVENGYATSLGRFTEHEDKLLTDFFTSRERSYLTDLEWDTLLKQLPTRTKNSCRYRIKQLGEDYAWKHGWAAYTKSGFCSRITERQRKAWLAKGIKI